MRVKLGRLFWKFFVIFWLAQFFTATGVGTLMWLWHGESRHHHEAMPPPHLRMPADGMPHSPEFVPPPQLRPHGEPGPIQHILPPLMPVIAGSIVSVVFAALLAWYFSRPIRSLRSAFEAVAGGSLATRVAPRMGKRRDELADLGKDFDRMATRLQAVVEGQQRLLHDVSHELRSPLARLQAVADLWRQQPERAAELVERIERDTARMDRLVGELLTLARIESGASGEASNLLTLNSLLQEVIDDLQLEAQQKGCRIALATDMTHMVIAQAELLRRAIENVVRNALHYSPQDGVVFVSMVTRGSLVWIEILDQGPGVGEAELDSIFEPFFRTAGSTPASGYGLGLSITKRVMLACGGGVAAENAAGGGLRVWLWLPHQTIQLMGS